MRKLCMEKLEERYLLSLGLWLDGGSLNPQDPLVFHSGLPVFTGTVNSPDADTINMSDLKFRVSKWDASAGVWKEWQIVVGTVGETTPTSAIATYSPAGLEDGYYAVNFAVSDKTGSVFQTSVNYVLIDQNYKLTQLATVGAFNMSNGTFVLQDRNSAGAGQTTLPIPSAASLIPLAGDWDGTGAFKIGAWDPQGRKFYFALQNSAAISNSQLIVIDLSQTGIPSGPVDATGFIPVVGDWDGDGRATAGMFYWGNPATGENAHFWATNTATSTSAPSVDFDIDIGAALGPGWIPIAGDWANAGRWILGAFNQANTGFYLPQSMSAIALGNVNEVVFGGFSTTLIPLARDWYGQSKATVGALDWNSGTFYLLSDNNTAAKLNNFTISAFASAGTIPIGGKWATPVSGAALADAALVLASLPKYNQKPIDQLLSQQQIWI